MPCLSGVHLYYQRLKLATHRSYCPYCKKAKSALASVLPQDKITVEEVRAFGVLQPAGWRCSALIQRAAAA